MSTPTPVRPIGMSLRRHHGFHTVTPYLVIKAAADAVRFYKQAFGATDLIEPLVDPASGKIVHAELRIGDSPVMLTDEFPQWDQRGPSGSNPVMLHLYVEDAESVFHQALAAGARELIPVDKQFYGARSGRLADPFGHVWVIETQLEDLSAEQLRSRYDDFRAG